MRRKKPIIKTLPDIGAEVKKLLRRDGMSYETFGRKCNWSRSTVCRLLKKRDWTMGELQTAGKVLNTDLLAYYNTNTEPMFPESVVKGLVAEKMELEKRIERLERDNKDLEQQLELCARQIEALEFSIKNGK